jgi:succinate dehydrogenase / fumarate reductase, membrane anchor subunit
MPSYRTSLSRVKGLGSAHEGTEHFWMQRVTGAINFILLLFVLFSALCVIGQPYDVVRGYFASPIVAALSILFTISATYHMRIGMQVVVEDYIHSPAPKLVLLFLNTVFAALVALTAMIAIIKLSLGA